MCWHLEGTDEKSRMSGIQNTGENSVKIVQPQIWFKKKENQLTVFLLPFVTLKTLNTLYVLYRILAKQAVIGEFKTALRAIFWPFF